MKDIKTFVLQRRLGLSLILLFQDFDRALDCATKTGGHATVEQHHKPI